MTLLNDILNNILDNTPVDTMNISPWLLHRTRPLLKRYIVPSTTRAASLNHAIHKGLRKSRVDVRGRREVTPGGQSSRGESRRPGGGAGAGSFSGRNDGFKRSVDRSSRSGGAGMSRGGGFGHRGERMSTGYGDDAGGAFSRRPSRDVADAGEEGADWETHGRRGPRDGEGKSAERGGDRGPRRSFEDRFRGVERAGDRGPPRNFENRPRGADRFGERRQETRGGFDHRSGGDRSNHFTRENRGAGQYQDDRFRGTERGGERGMRKYQAEAFTPRQDKFPGEESSNADDAGTKRMHKGIPLSLPYTTSASEFLYGTSVVRAAMTASSRQLYKLYIYQAENRDARSRTRDAQLERLAHYKKVEVEHVQGDFLRVMDKMAGGRPHNGHVLEASPLPRKPVASLGEVGVVNGVYGYGVTLEPQSAEERNVNGDESRIALTSSPTQQPLVLLLDSIEDPGNLGGIIRTASFLGITAVAVSMRGSATMTPVVLKAAAGACESLTLFAIEKPVTFVQQSKAAGWKIFAAVAPSNKAKTVQSVSCDSLRGSSVVDAPCLLMLGSEGHGLPASLRQLADVSVHIPSGNAETPVDSLNVSVAAGILCSAFRGPAPSEAASGEVEDAEDAEDARETAEPADEEENRVFSI